MLAVAIRKRLGDFALDAAFEAPLSGVIALFGPSGAGKTSIVAAIAGLLRPDEGHIRVGGATFFDASGVDLPAERRRVGYVFQDARLFPHMSVAGNLRYGLKRAPRGERRIAFEEVVGLLGIGHLLHRRPGGLSGGERQRVALGRALLAQPRLLLMDEPLASLDAGLKEEVLPYVERLRDELAIPIVYVSHAVEEVERLASTLVLVEGGRVVACDKLSALTGRADVPLLAGRADAAAVIEATVAGHDAERALTYLDFAGGRLTASLIAAPPGRTMRLRIQARDVVLAGEEPRNLSVHNVLAGTVHAIREEPGARALVQVGVGPTRLLARVTRDAVARLGLREGGAVFVLVKSVSVERPAARSWEGAD